MSRLGLFVRPFVEFDPKNREHRRHVATFLRTRAWGNAPYRFVVSGSLVTVAAIQQKLLEYYSAKEFKDG